jgi:hypothetical protein
MGCHRDEWIAAGAIDALHRLALDAYDRMLGLDLDHLAVGLRGPGRPCRRRRACWAFMVRTA